MSVIRSLGYSRKNPNRRRGREDMEFPGVLKKKHVEISGVNLKGSGIYKGVQEKIMLNFRGSWFLTLEFPKGVTQQFCRISRGESLFSREFPRDKVTNLKIPGKMFRKVAISTTPAPSLVCFFSGIAHSDIRGCVLCLGFVTCLRRYHVHFAQK